jgi:serine-type D-Ala-D-Ala carboxypeptidase (penicillin-binding protein 5/6)
VLVALEHADLSDVVTVSPLAAQVGESSVHLRAGERLTVRDLAIAALVPSANDAATALAAYVGNGSIPRFVDLMNQKATQLGLTSTHFANPHGLDQPGHVSSARDMTTLLTAALRNPFIRTWSTRSSAMIAGGRTLISTDDLIGTLPLIGAKTGHTNDAGWSQVAAVQGDGVRITASVLGSPTAAQRNADLGGLLAWGLSQYHLVEAIDTRRVYGLAETGYGRAPVRIVARNDVVRAVRVERPMVEKVVLSTALALPVTRGQQVGEVRVFAGGRLIARTPLVAAESVSAVGTAGKVRWYARRTVHHLVGLVS